MLRAIAIALGARNPTLASLEEAWRAEGQPGEGSDSAEADSPVKAAPWHSRSIAPTTLPLVIAFASIEVLACVGPVIEVARHIKAATLTLYLLLLGADVVRRRGGARWDGPRRRREALSALGLVVAVVLTVAELYGLLPATDPINYAIALSFTGGFVPYIVERGKSLELERGRVSAAAGLGLLVAFAAMSVPTAAVGTCGQLSWTAVPPTALFALIAFMSAASLASITIGYPAVQSIMLSVVFGSTGLAVLLNIWLRLCAFGQPNAQFSVPTSAMLALATATAFVLEERSRSAHGLAHRRPLGPPPEALINSIPTGVLGFLAIGAIALYSIALAANGTSDTAVAVVILLETATVLAGAYCVTRARNEKPRNDERQRKNRVRNEV